MRGKRATQLKAVGLQLVPSLDDETNKLLDVGACAPNPGLNTSHYYVDFTQQSSLPAEWILANYETVTFGSHGAEFTFNKRYDAPNIWTDFYIFFGHVDVVMQAAPGQGIVSSSVLISDDYDEIDWEFSGNNFGDASSSGQVQTNFYGKGDTGYYDRSGNENVNQPQASFHTYSVDWTKDQLVWSIDGQTVRTLLASQCDNDTHQYPQTPMKLQLGLWDGGDPDGYAGTVNWAGGYTNLSQAPFTMYVQSVSITNDNPGYGYNYTDLTASWESIQILTEPLNSTSSAPSSTVHTSTSFTPPTELSSSSLSPLPSSSSTSSVPSPSIGTSGTGLSIDGTSGSGSSGLVSSSLLSSSSPSISADAASASAATSNSENCDCEDETSTVSLSIPMSSQASQVSAANAECSQPASAGISTSSAFPQPPDQATTSLSLSSYTSVTQSVSQPSPSGLVPASYASSSAASQSQSGSQEPVPSSPSISEATPPTSQSYGSLTAESATQPTIQFRDSPLTTLTNATTSTIGSEISPKGNNTESISTTLTDGGSFLSPSKTSDHPSPVSALSVPTTPISASSSLQPLISVPLSESNTKLPDSPTSNIRSATLAKPTSNEPASDLNYSANSKWPSSYESTSSTRLTTFTWSTLAPSLLPNSSVLVHPTEAIILDFFRECHTQHLQIAQFDKYVALKLNKHYGPGSIKLRWDFKLHVKTYELACLTKAFVERSRLSFVDLSFLINDLTRILFHLSVYNAAFLEPAQILIHFTAITIHLTAARVIDMLHPARFVHTRRFHLRCARPGPRSRPPPTSKQQQRSRHLPQPMSRQKRLRELLLRRQHETV
ncbi:MAG: hypothetical protein Q9165_003332 [Trypethelium subeluteriae]